MPAGRKSAVRFLARNFQRRKCPDDTKAQRNPLLIPYLNRQRRTRAHTRRPLRRRSPRQWCLNYYAIEADRNTEPIDSSKAQALVLRKATSPAIATSCATNSNAAQYGVPNMQVLTITVSETHMRNIMSHLRRVAAERVPHLSGPRPFLFKAVPSLGRRINKPPVTGHILTTAFSRIDDDYVRIDQ